MYRKFIVIAAIAGFCISQKSDACATVIKGHKNQGSWTAYFTEHRVVEKTSRKPADIGRLPFAQLEPWGGDDKAKWKPEAVMANAVSEALNDGYADSGVKDVLVSMPVKMRYSGNERRVYGDGQTNSAVDLGEGWYEKEPALISTLTLFNDGSQKIRFRFHRKLLLTGRGAKIVYNGKVKQLNGSVQTLTGDTDIVWKPSKDEAPDWGDLFSSRVAFIQPAGWNDWFPVDFRNVVRPADNLLAQIPLDRQILGKGTLLDPESVSVQGKSGDQTPFDAMGSDSFGSELRAERYFPVSATGDPQGIHNVFLNGRVTAVGRGFSTVFQAPPQSKAPFKMAYICFDRRNRPAETTYGVPSGGGWHEIGDETETVFNTLEKSPVIFGYANGQPAASSPSGNFAYGLTDIAVIRKLMPGSAIITAAGSTTYAEDTSNGICLNAPKRGTGGPAGRNYHWFILDQPHEVCAVEWVHPNKPSPSNRLGLEPLMRAGCKETH